MNDNVAEPFRSILNKLWSLTAGWDPTALCDGCEHARLVGRDSMLRCNGDGVHELVRPPSFLPLCEEMRAPGGKCEHRELFSPRR